MPLSEYSIKDRIIGNIVLSFIMALITILGMICLSFMFAIPITPTTYFIFPSYFIMFTIFTEVTVRKERKLNANKITN